MTARQHRPLTPASLPIQVGRQHSLLLADSGEDAERDTEIDRHPPGPKSGALERSERSVEVGGPAERR